MTAREMMELAKAGYKPSEIAEMHKLMKDADPEIEEPKEEPKEEPTPQPKEEPKEEPEKDYKKLFEESQKQLAEVQRSNLSKDLAGNQPKEEDILAELVRSYM